MSIWSSVSGPDIRALDGHDDAANYRGEGEPKLLIDVDVARSHHNLIRLGVYRHAEGEIVDVCALLAPADVRELIRKLTVALGDD